MRVVYFIIHDWIVLSYNSMHQFHSLFPSSQPTCLAKSPLPLPLPRNKKEEGKFLRNSFVENLSASFNRNQNRTRSSNGLIVLKKLRVSRIPLLVDRLNVRTSDGHDQIMIEFCSTKIYSISLDHRVPRSWVLLDHARPSSSILEHPESCPITLLILVI